MTPPPFPPPLSGGNGGALLCHAAYVTELQMMQRVIAILTQAMRVSDALDEDESREDLNSDTELVGQLIREALDFDEVAVRSTDPQTVANAVAQALTLRVGLMASCFVGAFVRLAEEHDAGDADSSSVELLQRLVLEWELDDVND